MTGDKQLLSTISKEIQFTREKDIIQKLLRGKESLEIEAKQGSAFSEARAKS